jgi:hypothetical protein
LHCVMPLLARYGVTATCRASFALYNTKDEVDTLAESMVKAREFWMSDDTPTVEKPAEGVQPAPGGSLPRCRRPRSPGSPTRS